MRINNYCDQIQNVNHESNVCIKCRGCHRMSYDDGRGEHVKHLSFKRVCGVDFLFHESSCITYSLDELSLPGIS